MDGGGARGLLYYSGGIGPCITVKQRYSSVRHEGHGRVSISIAGHDK